MDDFKAARDHIARQVQARKNRLSLFASAAFAIAATIAAMAALR